MGDWLKPIPDKEEKKQLPRDTIVCTGQHKCPNAPPMLRETLDETMVELEL